MADVPECSVAKRLLRDKTAMRYLQRITWIEWLVIASTLLAVSALVVAQLDSDGTSPASLIVPAHVPAPSGGHGTVEVTLIGRHRGTTEKTVLVELALVNRTRQIVHYSGYSPDSYTARPIWGDISPLYAKEIKRDDGWSEKQIGWCGNGATRMRLKPGHAGRFTACVHEDEPVVRIGVRTWQGRDGQAVEQTVWSREIPFAGEPPDNRD